MPKFSSFKELSNIDRTYFFPFLKYLFDKPKEINYRKEKIYTMLPFQIFKYKNLIKKKNKIHVYLDHYNVYHGIFPKKDYLGRNIEKNINLFDTKCKKIIDSLLLKKKYKIYNSKTLYKVIRRIRNENIVLKEYLNLYMLVYDLATTHKKILFDKDFVTVIKFALKNWVNKLDSQYKQTLNSKKLIILNDLIAMSFYLYYWDSLLLVRKIRVFNKRNCFKKFDKDYRNNYKRTSLEFLSYSILRQKLRLNLLTIAIASFLKFKRLITY